jgi:D-arabinose 1-dehydrogenase-like Zn-dependent alcohol dehydrogenase
MQNLRPDDGKTYTLGHEGVGVIEKIHPSVEGKGFRVGDPVGTELPALEEQDLVLKLLN